MAEIHRCPVCDGCGMVPPDFYTRFGSGTSANREQCRTCSGNGVIWEAEARAERYERALREIAGPDDPFRAREAAHNLAQAAQIARKALGQR